MQKLFPILPQVTETAVFHGTEAGLFSVGSGHRRGFMPWERRQWWISIGLYSMFEDLGSNPSKKMLNYFSEVFGEDLDKTGRSSLPGVLDGLRVEELGRRCHQFDGSIVAQGWGQISCCRYMRYMPLLLQSWILCWSRCKWQTFKLQTC